MYVQSSLIQEKQLLQQDTLNNSLVVLSLLWAASLGLFPAPPRQLVTPFANEEICTTALKLDEPKAQDDISNEKVFPCFSTQKFYRHHQ